jgi:hypothetical protein
MAQFPPRCIPQHSSGSPHPIDTPPRHQGPTKGGPFVVGAPMSPVGVVVHKPLGAWVRLNMAQGCMKEGNETSDGGGWAGKDGWQTDSQSINCGGGRRRNGRVSWKDTKRGKTKKTWPERRNQIETGDNAALVRLSLRAPPCAPDSEAGRSPSPISIPIPIPGRAENSK